MSETRQIQHICGQLERGEIDNAQFLEQFARALVARIGCSRASVWIFSGSSEARSMHCVAMYDATVDAMTTATTPVVQGPAVAHYFDVMTRDGCVIAPDALTHAATSGIDDDYLRRSDVRSMLDVCFSVNGVLFGVFSCEQIGQPVKWTSRQVQLLRHIASRASLALLHAIPGESDTAPGPLWESSSPNRLATMPMPLDPQRKN